MLARNVFVLLVNPPSLDTVLRICTYHIHGALVWRSHGTTGSVRDILWPHKDTYSLGNPSISFVRPSQSGSFNGTQE